MFAAGNSVAASSANYIEDVFSTYLYTGNGSTQTITNGIDLAGEGGLVWLKNRGAVGKHQLYDTVRGVQLPLDSGATDAQSNYSPLGLSAFSTTGFSLGSGLSNNNAATYVSWTFRKQPKFFDVVTYTGTGAVQNIAHNLGSVPGCVITKKTSATSNWAVYHRGITSSETGAILLNTTAAFVTSASVWDNTAPTSTQFTVGTADATNISGQTYVAYLFAHNAGGFGLTGTDNVVSCGSYTGNGSATGPTVTLGYEPQWLLIKNTTSGVATSNWQLYDSMRGLNLSRSDYLLANKTDAENGVIPPDITPTATGFFPSSSNLWINANANTYIYIAIRRGPMKVPESGTEVYNGITRTGTGAAATVTANIYPVDLVISKSTNAVRNVSWWDRMRGKGNQIYSNSTAEEIFRSTSLTGFDIQNGYTVGADGDNLVINASGSSYVNWNFRRAPGFFDEVCYTGTGAASQSQSHNLAAVPELIIWKCRNDARDWIVYTAALGVSGLVELNSTNANNSAAAASCFNTAPTDTTFYFKSDSKVGANNFTYVAYLFATVAGVSKVGSYTGTAALQTVNCGFAAGARFVLIKRTDSTGDWYVWDSARGITSGNDPYLLINSTAAEVTATNYVDTDTTGFKVTAAAPAGINASGGTYIFLAIA